MRFNSRLACIAMTVAMLFCGRTGASGPPSLSAVSDGDWDTMVERGMADAGIVGLGAAIVVDGRMVWAKGYGFADRERAIAFAPHTVMNIASVSKTVTAAALMRAVEQGKLSLDEDINRYLPFRVIHPDYPEQTITLRQLATHTSGIADRGSVYENTYQDGGDSTQPLAQFLEGYLVAGGADYAKDNFVHARPGTRMEYSNIATGLAGYIVEQATGQRLDRYTREQFFKPLQMTDTGWFLADIDVSRHARLYEAESGTSIPIPLYGITTYPDGGVRTSVDDLAKFLIMLLNDGRYQDTQVLQKRSVAEMLRLQFHAANRPDNVDLDEENSGLFWWAMPRLGRTGHGGSDPGVKTEMLADPSRRFGLVLFTNTSLPESEKVKYNRLLDLLWAQAQSLGAGSQARPAI